MRMITAALLVLLGTQHLPTELQVSQLEDPRVRDAGIVIIGGQNPLITNTQRPQLPATQLEQRPQTQGLNATFDVNFRDAPLVAVLTTLAQYVGLNAVIPPDVIGNVTVDLRNVTLAQALDAILPPRGLQHTIEGNLLKIEKVQVESRSFKFDYITTQRSLSRSITAASTAASAGGFGGLGAFGLGTAGIGAAVPVTGNVGGTPFGFGGGGGGSSTSLSGAETTSLLTDIDAALNSLKSPD